MAWMCIAFILLIYGTSRISKGVAGNVFDVCMSCHPNATCDKKTDGSGGYVCNCKYGFVGNGRTLCQDKDECQIGNSICGNHTVCHNTHGSFYCTCLSGYAPTNQMDVFIPNDGTYCQDVDECHIEGICGEGGHCRNIVGDFECECRVGFRVQGGTIPFQPQRDTTFCKAVDCGSSPSIQHAVPLPPLHTLYGNVINYACQRGFLWKEGDNSSVCTFDGRWKGPSLICEEVNCGRPPIFPLSSFVWDMSTRLGAQVWYKCERGFRHVGPPPVALCTARGLWSHPGLRCEEIVCSIPPTVPNSHLSWDKNTSIGASVVYECADGYQRAGAGNSSVCTEHGEWSKVAFTCEEISCGEPLILPQAHVNQAWMGNTTVGSVAPYDCNRGFYYVSGTNISKCEANGYWTKPTVICKEIDCGQPIAVSNSQIVWTKDSHLGAQVFYECDLGYYNAGPGNTSMCKVDGIWSPPYVACQEISCGTPPAIPNSRKVWNHNASFAAEVFYECVTGFRNVGQGNVSVCSINGRWLEASMICQEISCGLPPVITHAVMRWDNTSLLGSMVQYTCQYGFYQAGGRDVLTCTSSGEWEKATLACKEINCGVPATFPLSHMLWTKDTHLGARVLYKCDEGFYNAGHGNTSLCTVDGIWSSPSILCQAKCGHVPQIANTELVWDNESVALHRCTDGFSFHSGHNMSLCGADGRWQPATLRCKEIRNGISHLGLLNERCLHWMSDGKKEDYKITVVGRREYQKPFIDKRKNAFSSSALSPNICLPLLPATNYTINITAVLANSTVSITTNTTIEVAPLPEIKFKDVEGPMPTLWCHRTVHTLDPICLYQVIVLPVEGTLVFDCNYKSMHAFKESSCHGEYVAAQFQVTDVGKELNFTVGDDTHYSGFHNAALEHGRDYYILLRTVCHWGQSTKHSCALWAKVRGTSYRMRLSALAAGITIAIFGCVVLAGYCYAQYSQI